MKTMDFLALKGSNRRSKIIVMLCLLLVIAAAAAAIPLALTVGGPTSVTTFTLRASGNVADYTPAVQDAIATKVATELVVPISDVTVTVTAASVLLSITVRGANSAAQEKMSEKLSTPKAASTFLNAATDELTITVSEVVVAPSSAASKTDADQASSSSPPPASPPLPSPSRPQGSTSIKELTAVEAAESQLMLGANLVPYESCTTLARSLRLYPGANGGEYVRLSQRYTGGNQMGIALRAGAEPEMAMATASSPASAGASAAKSTPASATADSYSQTNVQVTGIDESDIVKNDGSHIYSIGGSQLVILRAYPANARAVTSRTSLTGTMGSGAGDIFAAEEALLDGDVLTIFAATQLIDAASDRRFAAVVIQTWDVSNRTAPALLRSSSLEGSLVTARLINGYAYLAVSSSAHLASSPPDSPTPPDVMPVAALQDETRAASGGGGAAVLTSVTDCGSVSYVKDVQPRSLLTIASIATTADGKAPGSIVDRVTLAVGASWREASVYASSASLYVATYNSQWTCSGTSTTCAKGAWWCIDRQSSGRRRLRHGVWGGSNCTYSAATYIFAYTIDPSGSGLLTLRAKGAVPGYLLSQWALDEHADHLRVAYTLPASGARTMTDNGIDVLRASDLGRVGRVRGLGRGERIYSMRFAGDLGYMVTFRQIDPLYTLELSDPTSPRVLGELKIPGFSDYLHPVDNHTLLGIGMAGNDEGRIRGVKLALFDISDLNKPIEKGGIELGGQSSSTLVSDDHKALLFDPVRKLLVIPITEKQGWNCNMPPTFHGAKAFTLSDRGFLQVAAIEHGPNRSNTWAVHNTRWGGCLSSSCAAATIRRSLYIGDDLFTISDGEVRATSLTTFASTWSTPLHVREELTKEGTCTLDGAALPWSRVAASGSDIYAYNCPSPTTNPEPKAPSTVSVGRRLSYYTPPSSSTCTGADHALRNRQCTSAGSRSFSALLNDAVSSCGNYTCSETTSYNDCMLWF